LSGTLREALAIIACVAVSLTVLHASPKDGPWPAEASAEFLYGIPAGLDLEELVDRPKLVGTVNHIFNDTVSGERRMSGYAEVVAVYDLPLEKMLAVGLDFGSYPGFMPRVLHARVERQDGSTYQAYYDTGIKLLGIEISYKVRSESTVERLEGGAAGIRSRMLESLDGSLYENYNSFYLEPIIVKGKLMTFIRYFNRPGIRRPSAGTLQIVRLFAASEAKAQVAAIAKQTVRERDR
jgi:hypothetical protein